MITTIAAVLTQTEIRFWGLNSRDSRKNQRYRKIGNALANFSTYLYMQLKKNSITCTTATWKKIYGLKYGVIFYKKTPTVFFRSCRKHLRIGVFTLICKHCDSSVQTPSMRELNSLPINFSTIFNFSRTVSRMVRVQTERTKRSSLYRVMSWIYALCHSPSRWSTVAKKAFTVRSSMYASYVPVQQISPSCTRNDQ